MEEGEGDQDLDLDPGDEETILEEGFPLGMVRVGSVGWVSGDRHRRMEVSTWVGKVTYRWVWVLDPGDDLGHLEEELPLEGVDTRLWVGME
jgi:hypothetical protein